MNRHGTGTDPDAEGPEIRCHYRIGSDFSFSDGLAFDGRKICLTINRSIAIRSRFGGFLPVTMLRTVVKFLKGREYRRTVGVEP